MNHRHIVKIISSGKTGSIVFGDGGEENNILYIVLEYVSGISLFTFIDNHGPMGENAGKRFLR